MTIILIEFDMTNESPIHYCLGNHIIHNQHECWILLYQTQYLSNILHRYNMDVINSAPTPMEFRIKFNKDN
jgi:hypothetical protein